MIPQTKPMRFAFLLLAVLAFSMTLPAMAQDGGRGGRGGGGERPRFEDMSEEDREAFREMIQQRMAERQAQIDEQRRETLGMSEDEYDLIQPMVAKIQQLTQERSSATRSGAAQAGRGGRGGDAGGRGGRGGDAGGRGGDAGGRGGFGFEREMSQEGTRLSEATTALREFIDDEDSSAKDINDALSELRQAREAMDAEITEQREDLRALLTARQEAGMVLIGILD